MKLVTKDLALAVDLARDVGVPVEMAALVEQIHRRARLRYGDEAGEMSAIRLYEDLGRRAAAMDRRSWPDGSPSRARRTAVAAAIDALIAPSRAEPGNLIYEAHPLIPADPRVFLLYEQYDDEAGYRAHGESRALPRATLRRQRPAAPGRRASAPSTRPGERPRWRAG